MTDEQDQNSKITDPARPFIEILQIEQTLRIELTRRSRWIIGRSRRCDVSLSDARISRRHALLHLEGNETCLVDFGSRNGTYVNGKRVTTPIFLVDGDHISFGGLEASFHSKTESVVPSDSKPGQFETMAAPTEVAHERKLLSVLVVDVRNFTGLTGALGDDLLAQVMGTWFNSVGNALEEFDSCVDKYIGDAVMAVWFHERETPSRDEFKNVFGALLEIQRVTQDVNLRFTLPMRMQVGAAVNTGQVLVGNSGTGTRPDYTPLGDSINIAFRLEAATRDVGSDVLIGEQTYRDLANVNLDGDCWHRESVQLKGYAEPHVAFASDFVKLEEFSFG